MRQEVGWGVYDVDRLTQAAIPQVNMLSLCEYLQVVFFGG